MKHDADYLKGFMAGRAIAVRLAGLGMNADSDWYLYNGVRLPKLPEWDRETYPYAVISIRSDSISLYALRKDAGYFYDDSYSCFGVEGPLMGDGGLFWALIETEDGMQWFYVSGWSSVVISDELTWSNFDLYTDNTRNTLFIPASKPIPTT